MGKPAFIQLGDVVEIPILFEDRSVLAIDKPAGWMLAPDDWDRTGRNLQLAITSSIKGREFWAKSRNLKFLRFIHRLDAETSGVLLFAKSPGAVPVYSRLFESRQLQKTYLAVVEGRPAMDEWRCGDALGPEPGQPGRMRIDPQGKPAETRFKVLQRSERTSLVEATPVTGRTHQIRVHLRQSGHAVIGDSLYGSVSSGSKVFPLGLRAVALIYRDPFSRRQVFVRAPREAFMSAFGFTLPRLKSSAPDDSLSSE